MTFKIDDLTVIYAEDEMVFREIALPSIMKAGVPEESIKVAGDGLAALDHLNSLQDLPGTAPLLMLLDVMMPGMSGDQCAKKVKELVAQKALKTEPFMVCCSSTIRQISFEHEAGAFNVALPKPFGKKEVSVCLEKAREWWASRCGEKAAAAYDPMQIDILVAGDEPICNMSVLTTLGNVGTDQGRTQELAEQDEMVAALEKAVQSEASQPLVLLLGSPQWAPVIANIDTSRRRPFVVNTSGEAASASTFDAQLPPQFSTEDLEAALRRSFGQHSL